jgi:hypothetical protein
MNVSALARRSSGASRLLADEMALTGGLSQAFASKMSMGGPLLQVNTEIIEKQGGVALDAGLLDHGLHLPSERPQKVIKKLNPDRVLKRGVKLFARESGRGVQLCVPKTKIRTY